MAKKLNIRIFFLICIIVLIGAMGIWYATLPSQSEFLKDKRWMSDQQNLKRKIEDEAITVLYVYREEGKREYVRGEITTSSEHLNVDHFHDVLERFEEALPETVDPSFIEYIGEGFTERGDRYSAALTRAEFRLIEEEFESISPYVPPIVSERSERNVTVYALSLFEDVTRWDAYIMAEDRGEEGWVVTEDMAERFIPDQYILQPEIKRDAKD